MLRPVFSFCYSSLFTLIGEFTRLNRPRWSKPRWSRLVVNRFKTSRLVAYRFESNCSGSNRFKVIHSAGTPKLWNSSLQVWSHNLVFTQLDFLIFPLSTFISVFLMISNRRCHPTSADGGPFALLDQFSIKRCSSWTERSTGNRSTLECNSKLIERLGSEHSNRPTVYWVDLTMERYQIEAFNRLLSVEWTGWQTEKNRKKNSSLFE